MATFTATSVSCAVRPARLARPAAAKTAVVTKRMATKMMASYTVTLKTPDGEQQPPRRLLWTNMRQRHSWSHALSLSTFSSYCPASPRPDAGEKKLTVADDVYILDAAEARRPPEQMPSTAGMCRAVPACSSPAAQAADALSRRVPRSAGGWPGPAVLLPRRRLLLLRRQGGGAYYSALVSRSAVAAARRRVADMR